MEGRDITGILKSISKCACISALQDFELLLKVLFILPQMGSEVGTTPHTADQWCERDRCIEVKAVSSD